MVTQKDIEYLKSKGATIRPLTLDNGVVIQTVDVSTVSDEDLTAFIKLLDDGKQYNTNTKEFPTNGYNLEGKD